MSHPAAFHQAHAARAREDWWSWMRTAALSFLVLLPFMAGAQESDFWEQRSGGRPLATPDYADPVPSKALGLPKPLPHHEPPLSARERIRVDRFDLIGNTIFSASELAVVTAPYLHRMLTAEELQDVRRQLTLYYVERGYLNSGAVIPDQPVENGVVQIRIIEGRLTALEVTGATHLADDYFQQRLRPEADTPLNVSGSGSKSNYLN